MRTLLVAAAWAWPLLLASAVWPPPPATHSWAPLVYLVASRICHQLPARSFHTAGVQWPVCARCAGLYLSAPFGALAAVLVASRVRMALGLRWRLFLIVALPTALTLGVEWSGLSPLSNVIRAATALPLGAGIAFLIVHIVGPSGSSGATGSSSSRSREAIG